MTTNQTIDGVPRRVCYACVTLPRNSYCPICDDEPAAQPQGETVAFDFESAAQKIACCMDYPWEHMPEKGRDSMREHAKAIINAALSGKAEQPAPVALK